VCRVARAAPDGYTIDIGQWDTHVGSIIYNLSYDLQKDFEPIGLISVNPQLMVGKKALPADDLKGLVAWMNANPGKITFVNQNAAGQVSGILLQQLTDTRVQFIPYRGSPPALQDLMGGQIDLMIDQSSAPLPHVRAGKINWIAKGFYWRSVIAAAVAISRTGQRPHWMRNSVQRPRLKKASTAGTIPAAPLRERARTAARRSRPPRAE
jgi:tripartite-type tricarboxylate transporter receptor subunit TctC